MLANETEGAGCSPRSTATPRRRRQRRRQRQRRRVLPRTPPLQRPPPPRPTPLMLPPLLREETLKLHEHPRKRLQLPRPRSQRRRPRRACHRWRWRWRRRRPTLRCGPTTTKQMAAAIATTITRPTMITPPPATTMATTSISISGASTRRRARKHPHGATAARPQLLGSSRPPLVTPTDLRAIRCVAQAMHRRRPRAQATPPNSRPRPSARRSILAFSRPSRSCSTTQRISRDRRRGSYKPPRRRRARSERPQSSRPTLHRRLSGPSQPQRP